MVGKENTIYNAVYNNSIPWTKLDRNFCRRRIDCFSKIITFYTL